MRTRVKFCGLRRAEDVKLAVSMGVDAIGLVFYAGSKRAVEASQAAELCAHMPAFVTPVGLFVNPTAQQVESVLTQVPLGLLQFHGEEEADFCQSFGVPYIKAVRMRDSERLLHAVSAHPLARGFLVDAFNAQSHGGTGTSFDWSLLPEVDQPIILAGGLGPDNVAQAIAQVQPYAVDVSSSIESVPGVKDADRMRAFLEQVRLADQSNG